jgi:hypothetical protein
MLAIDVHETAAVLLQVRGVVVLVEIALFCLLPWLGAAAPAVRCAASVLATVSSHAPSAMRYRLLSGRGPLHGGSSRGWGRGLCHRRGWIHASFTSLTLVS